MKNKLGFARMFGIIVSALVVFFVGCDNGAQEVEGSVSINYQKATPVASVSVDKVTTGTYAGSVRVSCDAVDNVSNYYVCYQQEGKKTISISSTFLRNDTTYSLDSTTSTNTDPDKWSGRISGDFQAGKKYRFGVMTESFVGNVSPSDITWSKDYTQF